MCRNVRISDYKENQEVMESQQLISLICDGKSLKEICDIMKKGKEEIYGMLENIKALNPEAHRTLRKILHD